MQWNNLTQRLLHSSNHVLHRLGAQMLIAQQLLLFFLSVVIRICYKEQPIYYFDNGNGVISHQFQSF